MVRVRSCVFVGEFGWLFADAFGRALPERCIGGGSNWFWFGTIKFVFDEENSTETKGEADFFVTLAMANETISFD